MFNLTAARKEDCQISFCNDFWKQGGIFESPRKNLPQGAKLGARHWTVKDGAKWPLGTHLDHGCPKESSVYCLIGQKIRKCALKAH